jgi:hypothetical protein
MEGLSEGKLSYIQQWRRARGRGSARDRERKRLK